MDPGGFPWRYYSFTTATALLRISVGSRLCKKLVRHSIAHSNYPHSANLIELMDYITEALRFELRQTVQFILQSTTKSAAKLQFGFQTLEASVQSGL